MVRCKTTLLEFLHPLGILADLPLLRGLHHQDDGLRLAILVLRNDRALRLFINVPRGDSVQLPCASCDTFCQSIEERAKLADFAVSGK